MYIRLFAYWLLGIFFLSSVLESQFQVNWQVHTEHHTARCLHPGSIFIYFFLSWWPFPLYWLPFHSISFREKSSALLFNHVALPVTAQNTHTDTHTPIPERGARGMWHLFSLRWAPHVLDLIHIVSEYLGGRRGGCMTRGHCEEKGGWKGLCMCVQVCLFVRGRLVVM